MLRDIPLYDLLLVVLSLGVRSETSTRVGGAQGFESEGLRGLKALGVRELSYRLAFLACNVAPTNPRVRNAFGQIMNGYITT